MDGTRGGTAMSESEMPQARQGAAAAGVERGLHRRRVQQRVVARGQRVDQVGQHEADPFGVSLVQAGLGHHAFHGSPRWPGTPASRGAAAGCPPSPGRRTGGPGGTAAPASGPRRCGPARRPAAPPARRPAAAWRPAPRPGAGQSRPGSSGAACRWPHRRAVGQAAPPRHRQRRTWSYRCRRSLPAERSPARRALPLVARHEPWIRRGSAGTGPVARHQGQPIHTRPRRRRIRRHRPR